MTENDRQPPASHEAGRAKQDWEQTLLERLAFASLNEQRKARRWSIFFKAFFAIYLVILLVMALSSDFGGVPSTGGKYTALVDLSGVIAANANASADNVVSGLRAAFESKAKGVILRTNSPGGSPVQASYINSEIQRLRKKYPNTPVYAVIGDICASGCYYAVAATDRIFANESSIVGSIGVLMNGFGFVDGMKKLGIERRLLTAGDHKNFLDPFSPMHPEHREHAQALLNRIHQQFIDVVKQGRGESLKQSKETFSGLFWTGDEALQMGLIDEFGSASYVAREVVGTDDIVDFTHRENLLDRFAQRIGTAMAQTLGTELLARIPQLR
jgi:protease IV